MEHRSLFKPERSSCADLDGLRRVMDLFPRLRERREIRAGKALGRRAAYAGESPRADDQSQLYLMDEPTEGWRSIGSRGRPRH